MKLQKAPKIKLKFFSYFFKYLMDNGLDFFCKNNKL